MATILHTAKGVNGEIDLLEDRITIRRKGVLSFMTQGVKGDKDILLSQITAIQFKRAGLTSGYIQFSFTGGQEAKGGIFQGTKDENTVMFRKGKQEDAFPSLERTNRGRSGVDNRERHQCRSDIKPG